MIIQLREDSDLPIYVQLVNEIMELIANDTLQEGMTLPSVRSLAADLAINMHTINKSYRELEKKGLVRIIPKSGAVIHKRLKKDEQIEQITSIIRPVLAEAHALGLTTEDIDKVVASTILSIKEEKI